MSAPRELSPVQREETLRNAIEKQVPLVATVWEQNRWVVLRSKFIARDPGSGVLCIEPPSTEPLSTSQKYDVASGTNLGVTFRRGHHKCMFATTVVGKQRVVLSPTLRMDAILIRRPDQLQQLQRRAYLRATVPAGVRIPVALFEGGWRERGDTSGPPSVVAMLADLSAGGIRVIVPDDKLAVPSVGRTLALELRPEASSPIRVDALYRHCQAEPAGGISWGLQLVGHEASTAQSAALSQITKLVNDISR